jgi:hypothetical protein
MRTALKGQISINISKYDRDFLYAYNIQFINEYVIRADLFLTYLIPCLTVGSLTEIV